MEQWTHETRKAFVEKAVNSEEEYGKSGNYIFKRMEKQMVDGCMVEDARRATVTRVLAEALFTPEFKSLALSFYSLLVHKLCMNPVVGNMCFREFIVLMKGSNAHVYLNGGIMDDVFRVSDTDIVVCINPFLPIETFDVIKRQVEITIRQTMSQYKRTLDQMLYLNGGTQNNNFAPIVPENVTAGFKQAFTAKLEAVKVLEGEDIEMAGGFISPFKDNETRNKCSRNSFIITNSKASKDHVVRVEVPHFDMCERVPLKRTPFFCSFNETIDFSRDDTGSKGRFNLYRLKMNVLHRWTDVEIGVQKEDKIPADVFDVSIPDRDDVELIHFWSRGMSVNVLDKDTHIWVTIPDVPTCIAELTRILDTYESVESKKEKRMKKLEALKSMCGYTQ